MRSSVQPSSRGAIAEVGQGRTTVLVLFLLLLGSCQPFARRESRPSEDRARIASPTIMLANTTATAAAGRDESMPAAGYPDPQAFLAPADITATAEMAVARPTLPADLPDSGPIEPAVDLARLAAEPFLLAWVDDQGLWLFEQADEAPRRLVEGQGFRRPQLDPDRRAIIWQTVDPARADDQALWSLWSMPLDGEPGDARQILTPAELPPAIGLGGQPCSRWIREIHWLRGERPALAFGTSTFEACGGFSQYDIWTLEIGLLEPDRLLGQGVTLFRPAPDGERFAIIVAEEASGVSEPPSWLAILDRATGEIERLLTAGPYGGLGEHIIVPEPLWVDGGEAIVIAIEAADAAEHYRFGPLQEAAEGLALRIEIDGDRSRFGAIPGPGFELRLARTNPLIPERSTTTRKPYWSSDFRRLALIERPAPIAVGDSTESEAVVERSRLLIAGGDGSDPTAYTEREDIAFLGWAPTAQRFLYTDGQAVGEARRLFVGAPGEEPRLLFEAKAEDEYIGMARWAGDDHVVILREGLPTPPLLELHGLDGSSRGLAQSVGIEVDAVP